MGAFGSQWLDVGVGNKSGGAATSAITVSGYPSEHVVVDWGTLTGGDVSRVRCAWGAEYWTLANLQFDLRNQGTDTVSAYVQADYGGIARPQARAFDMGAHEHVPSD